MLDNSTRLSTLYYEEAPHLHKIETNVELNQRDYWRNYQSSPNTRVSDTFINNNIPPADLATVPFTSHSANTRKVAALHHANTFEVPDLEKLRKFLTPTLQIGGIWNAEIVPNIPKHTNFEPFVNIWFTLYEAARQQTLSHDSFGIVWSVLAHENDDDIEPILALQAVATNPKAFADIRAPQVPIFRLKDGYYSPEVMRDFLKCQMLVPHPNGYSHYRVEDVNQSIATIEQVIDPTLAHIQQHWPCPRVDTIPQYSESIGVHSYNLLLAINEQLATWYANHQHQTFIAAVLEQFEALGQGANKIDELDEFPEYFEAIAQYPTKHQIEINVTDEMPRFADELYEAEGIWYDGHKMTRSLTEWWDVYKELTNGGDLKYLAEAGLSPRCVPSLVLPQIVSLQTYTNPANRKLCALIGVIAIATVREQRAKRIAAYELQMKLPADHEIEPHTNWQPYEWPEWLLFEIEQDLCIRPIQIEVAKRMINPMTDDSDCRHAVMQLNMGEGKTSVIVPILAAHLANGKQVCQITVLKSLFATNSNALRQSLGGLLNHRVYHFPCRRDMPIGERSALLLHLYKECMEQRGKAICGVFGDFFFVSYF